MKKKGFNFLGLAKNYFIKKKKFMSVKTLVYFENEDLKGMGDEYSILLKLPDKVGKNKEINSLFINRIENPTVKKIKSWIPEEKEEKNKTSKKNIDIYNEQIISVYNKFCSLSLQKNSFPTPPYFLEWQKVYLALIEEQNKIHSNYAIPYYSYTIIEELLQPYLKHEDFVIFYWGLFDNPVAYVIVIESEDYPTIAWLEGALKLD